MALSFSNCMLYTSTRSEIHAVVASDVVKTRAPKTKTKTWTFKTKTETKTHDKELGLVKDNLSDQDTNQSTIFNCNICLY